MNTKLKQELQEILKSKSSLSKKDSIYLIKKYGQNNIDDYLNELINKNSEYYDQIIKTYKELLEQIEASKNEETFNEYIENYNQLDSIKLYLKEIGKFSVLTKEQEQELAKRIKNGDTEARDTLINCNLKLAVFIAKRYIGKDISFNDLIQNANEGLIKAVDRYDYTKGYRFSTYATILIKQQINMKLIEEKYKFKISGQLYSKIVSYKMLNEKYLAEKGREMNDEETKQELNLNDKSLKLLKRSIKQIISYDTLFSKEEDGEEEPTIYNIEDENTNIEKEVEEKITKEKLLKILQRYNIRERYILINRIGYNKENKEKTLEEIGQELKITRERVRQIESRVKRRIRYDIAKEIEKKVI